MRTTKLTTLTKLPSIERNKTQELSKITQNLLDEFKNRQLNLLWNSLSEYGFKAKSILDMKNTTKEEETWIQLWQMFWHSLNKMWWMVEKDRIDKQIENMLAPFWLNLTRM